MVEKVVGIHGSPIVGEPVPNVVETLKELLREAEAGDVRAVAFVVVNRDGTVATAWEQPVSAGGVARSIESHALGNGILMLSYRFAEGGLDD